MKGLQIWDEDWPGYEVRTLRNVNGNTSWLSSSAELSFLRLLHLPVHNTSLCRGEYPLIIFHAPFRLFNFHMQGDKCFCRKIQRWHNLLIGCPRFHWGKPEQTNSCCSFLRMTQNHESFNSLLLEMKVFVFDPSNYREPWSSSSSSARVLEKIGPVLARARRILLFKVCFL